MDLSWDNKISSPPLLLETTIWSKDWPPSDIKVWSSRLLTSSLHHVQLLLVELLFWSHAYSLEITQNLFSLKLCKCSQTLHPSPRAASTPNRTVSISLITTNTSHALNHITLLMSKKILDSSWTLIPFINTRTKRENLRFAQHSHFVQLHQGQMEGLVY